MRRIAAFLFLAAFVVAAPAKAQDRKVHLNLGGGYTFSLSDVRKHLGDGYNFNIGVVFDVTPVLSVQGEYGYNGLGEKKIADTVNKVDYFAGMNMQYGDFNLLFRPNSEAKARPYFLAGIGVYYRPVEVTTPSVGYVPGYCDPWWYVCWPGGFVPTDKVIASASSTDFGMNFGGGVNVQLSDSASLYFEIRYHYIWGPELKDKAGKSYGKANGQFLPITVGFRF